MHFINRKLLISIINTMRLPSREFEKNFLRFMEYVISGGSIVTADNETGEPIVKLIPAVDKEAEIG